MARRPAFRPPALLGVVAILQAAFPAAAQIVRDGTVGPAGPPAGRDNFLIPAADGRVVGANLFHSFREFNLSRGQAATFSGPREISNVLARVTGGRTSYIDGKLACDIEGANFYLINPAGVVFGPGASLDVKGSFAVTTADFVRLADGGRFDAANPAASVLTTAAPAAFGFLSRPQAVAVQAGVATAEVDAKMTLAVPAGRVLSAVGGAVTIVGGQLVAPGGRVNVVSVDSPGEVKVDPADRRSPIDVRSFERLGDVRLSQGAGVDVGGPGGGSALFRAHSMSLDGASILNDLEPVAGLPAGPVDINLTGPLSVVNSLIRTLTDGEAGAGGDINLTASGVSVSGEWSLIQSLTSGRSRAGDIRITTGGDVEVAGGGAVSVLNVGPGAPGDISIAADAVRVDGRAAGQFFNTVIANNTDEAAPRASTGNAGGIHIRANSLEVMAGGQIQGDTLTSGNGANISIIAQRVLLDGLKSGGKIDHRPVDQGGGGEVITSVAAATRLRRDGGRGGDVSVEATDLRILDGAFITASTRGSGDGGSVDVAAHAILLDAKLSESAGDTGGGSATARQFTGITVATNGFDDGGRATGNAGRLRVRAGDLRVLPGAEISANTSSSGDGGSIDVMADHILLRGAGQDVPTGINAPTFDTGVGGGKGNGGDIVVNAGTLRVENGARISASTAPRGPFQKPGTGNAGQVNITANGTITLSGGGRVETFSDFANAGDILIRSAAGLHLDGGRIAARAGVNGGNVSLSGPGPVSLVGSTITAEAANSGGKIIIASPSRTYLRNSRLTTMAGQTGGDIVIDSPLSVALSSSRVTASATNIRAGDIQIQSATYFRSTDSVVVANSEFGQPGIIQTAAPETEVAAGLSALGGALAGRARLLDRCGMLAEKTVSTFVVAGRGGTPVEPGGWVPAGTVRWVTRQGGTGVADGRLARAAEAAGRGDFSAAATLWRDEAQSGGTAIGPRCDAMVNLSAACTNLGQYHAAEEAARGAIGLAERAGDSDRVVAATSQLGAVLTLTGRFEEAEICLSAAWARGSDDRHPAACGAVLVNRGNLAAARGLPGEAATHYRRAVDLAKQADDPLLGAMAAANAALLAARAVDGAAAVELAGRAAELASMLGDCYDKAALLLAAGRAYHQIAGGRPSPAAGGDRPRVPELQRRAFSAYERAAGVAAATGDARVRSFALGHLGHLLEDMGRTDEALLLTRQAVFHAQAAQAPDALYRWQWQTGRLLRATGRRDEAVAALRRAVETLLPIRNDIALGLGNRPPGPQGSSFREDVGPVLFELADLLLERAGDAGVDADAGREQAALAEARETVELLKSAELEDYFQNYCRSTLRIKLRAIDALASRTAVVYLIPLRDRTELLVSLPSGLRRFRSPVGSERLTAEVRAMRDALEDRTTHGYKLPAQQLHEWLIAPIEPALAAAGVDTLVFVPDGALRTVPIAALFDGKDFLIDRYAVAVSPGLRLLEAGPGAPRGRLLAAGLSEKRQGFPALEYVKLEVDRLGSLYPDKTVLMNQEFKEERVDAELRKVPYSIVHFASHGEVTADYRQSFVLTYDGRLTLDDLEALIGLGRYRDQPVELLTLSACKTAAGDDRAALGLAGIAVKAGARSAMATLWQVNDQASAQLVSDFYARLHADPSASKAKALRQAQLGLRADARYGHPCYWAPYLLIGNWR